VDFLVERTEEMGMKEKKWKEATNKASLFRKRSLK